MMHVLYFLFSPTYIFVLIGISISFIASVNFNTTVKKYSRQRVSSGLTGSQTALKILQEYDVPEVNISAVRGSNNDRYNPLQKTAYLSESTFYSDSITAVAIAAHESGHAIQHKKHYIPLTVRAAVLPAANFGSVVGFPLCFISLLLRLDSFWVQAGMWMFAFALIFHLVTLPVEFDASRRALKELKALGIVDKKELKGVKKVLRVAAMTYVAGTAVSALQLLRLHIITSKFRILG